jgi:sigma-B regulation protein RsbU (phosphoserine phosphatase)
MLMRVDDLRESNELLNLVMDRMTAALFLTDEDVRLQEFNNSLQKLFCKPEGELINQLCGNALGCAFAVEEGNPCGETSHCTDCRLRNAIQKALVENVPTFKARLHRNFYINGKSIPKHFMFSAQRVSFNTETMVLVVIDDITEIEAQRLELVEKQLRLDKDLQTAAGIQQSLLPAKFPKLSKWSFGSKFVPCETVGGDIFNLFRLDEDRLVIYMIDVSGHGVPSALITVSVSQMLHPVTGFFRNGHIRKSPGVSAGLGSPREVLEALDQHYPFDKFDTFFTISYLVLNTMTGEALYANAGHPAPIVIGSGGRLEVLEEGGTIIGLGGAVPFEEGKTKLVPGDRLLIYTDGLSEYCGSDGISYGESRLRKTLIRLRTLSIQDMLDQLYLELAQFGGNTKPQDDISILGVEFCD